eukprot:GHVU01090532.1.p1 GENE.GHVU01090532.1~~GHVU01090532.1.p1  ORF type:complete len:109 (+),score=7.21 GHVU01090532.1:613-939(+)
MQLPSHVRTTRALTHSLTHSVGRSVTHSVSQSRGHSLGHINVITCVQVATTGPPPPRRHGCMRRLCTPTTSGMHATGGEGGGEGKLKNEMSESDTRWTDEQIHEWMNE